MTNELDAEIKVGMYAGDPIKVVFGKPFKIYCRGKDVTDTVMELHIEISPRGQILHLKFAETSKDMIGSAK